MQRERRRKARLAEKIGQLERYRAAPEVRIPVPAVPPGGLPEGITLTAGRITVEFSGAEDLLSKLYGLAQRAAQEFESFQAMVTGGAPE